MIRTQVYLTEEEKSALNSLAAQVGKSQSDLIRDAVDDLVCKHSKSRQQAILHRVAGIWKHRKEIPDLARIRREWDRTSDP